MIAMFTPLASLSLACLVSASMPQQTAPPTAPPTATPVPPPVVQNAPPSLAMTRSDPKIEDVRLDISLYGSEAALPTARQLDKEGNTVRSAPYRLGSGAHIGIPVITRTSWCDTDFTQLDTRVYTDGRETILDPATTYRKLGAGVEAIIDIPVPASNEIGYNEIRARLIYKVQLWELDVDEGMAARSTWPRSWGTAFDRYLGGDNFIIPTDPAIKSCAEGSTPGGARSVSPFYAARNAVVAILARWKSVSGGTSELGPDSTLRGIRTSPDGYFGIGVQRGSAVELAVTCVAAVRAIGIPSRVVYCLTEDGDNARGKSQTKFRYICEFYLKDVGWIPFDPIEMRGSGATSRLTNGPLKGFANVDDIETALPIALRPIPDGYAQADRIACWGWIAPGARIDSSYAISRMYLDFTGRGNGKTPRMPAPAGDEGS